MEFNAASYKKLEDAGVYVQAEPSLDGNTDTTIRYEPVPQYRKSGVARQVRLAGLGFRACGRGLRVQR
jgi:hypothetical protein